MCGVSYSSAIHILMTLISVVDNVNSYDPDAYKNRFRVESVLPKQVNGL